MFNFLNFRRTCTIEMKDFINLLWKDLDMSAHVPKQQFDIFI